MNRIVCKLRLIEHGLLIQSDKLDDLPMGSKRRRGETNAPEHSDDENPNDSSEEEVDAATLMERRNAYVARLIRLKGSAVKENAWMNARNEATTEKRRTVLRDFMTSIGRSQKCPNCGG